MLTPNTTHIDYDPALELLALLPHESTPVSLSNLAADLGVPNQAAVRKLADQLESRGYSVRITQGQRSGFVACLPARYWRKAQREAETYLAMVEQ